MTDIQKEKCCEQCNFDHVAPDSEPGTLTPWCKNPTCECHFKKNDAAVERIVEEFGAWLDKENEECGEVGQLDITDKLEEMLTTFETEIRKSTLDEVLAQCEAAYKDELDFFGGSEIAADQLFGIEDVRQLISHLKSSEQ